MRVFEGSSGSAPALVFGPVPSRLKLSCLLIWWDQNAKCGAFGIVEKPCAYTGWRLIDPCEVPVSDQLTRRESRVSLR